MGSSRKPKIYVAGPYTKGDVALNVRTALLVAELIVDAGGVPFVPHLTHFWHFCFPRLYEFWLEYDLEWLRVCDGLVRIPGESSGADNEVQASRDELIPRLILNGIGNSDRTHLRYWVEELAGKIRDEELDG